MQNRFRIPAALILVAVLLLQVFGISGVPADAAGDTAVTPQIVTSGAGDLAEYQDYIKQNEDCADGKNDIIFAGGAFVSQEGGAEKGSYLSQDNVLLWKEGNGEVSWEFYVDAAGFYQFFIEFSPLKTGTDMELGLLLDGVVPFVEAEKLVFSKDWVNATKKPRTDLRGNEIAPEQVVSEQYMERVATDQTGVVLEPFRFLLKEGAHKLTLVGHGYAIAVSKLGFSAPETTQDYKTLAESYNIKKKKDVAPIVIHAEDAAVKSSNTLIPRATNGSAEIYPSDPYLSKINTIGGSSWNMPGDKITWKFTVKTPGYYCFKIQAK